MANYYNKIVRIVRAKGSKFYKQGKGDHEKWIRPDGIKFTIDKCCKNRHTANGILRDAGCDKAF